MRFLTLAMTFGLVLSLSSCATCDPNRYTKRAILVGTLAGVVSGAFLFDNALALAIGEGAAGFYIGRSMDRQEMAAGTCVELSDAIEEINHDNQDNTDLVTSSFEDSEVDLVTPDESSLEISKTAMLEPEVKPIGADEIIIDTVYSRGYKVGSSAVPGGLASMLGSAVNVLNSYPDTRLYLAGHTDSTGDARHNHFLSIQRAANAAIFVTEQGVKESRIEIMGHGEERPIATNSTKDGRSQNRRLEIKIRRTEEGDLSIGKALDSRQGNGDQEPASKSGQEHIIRDSERNFL